VIGFATSGKTFFINRLKRYLRQEGGYEPDPPPADDESQVAGTTQIETHRFDVLRADAEMSGGVSARHFRRDREPFYLIDIPGDQFRNAIEANAGGEQAATLIKVLRLSRVLILVLPADELLAPAVRRDEGEVLIDLRDKLAALGDGNPDEASAVTKIRNRLKRRIEALETEKRLDGLLDNISTISAMASELTDEDGNRLSLERFQALSRSEQIRLYTGPRRGPAPFTYVAITKADLLINERHHARITRAYPDVEEPDLLDESPGDLLRLLRPKIHKRIIQSFSWHKFDFVTCFDGQPAGSTRILYRLPHYGVEAWWIGSTGRAAMRDGSANGAKVMAAVWERFASAGVGSKAG